MKIEIEIEIEIDVFVFFSSRPGRPPKRNSTHPLDECLEDKRMKLSSSLLLRSFPDFPNPSRKKKTKMKKFDENFLFFSFLRLAFKYPVHSNGYLSVPSSNGNQSSTSFSHSFPYSAFAPTLPMGFPSSHPYLLADARSTRLNETNGKTLNLPTPPSQRNVSSSKKMNDFLIVSTPSTCC